MVEQRGPQNSLLRVACGVPLWTAGHLTSDSGGTQADLYIREQSEHSLHLLEMPAKTYTAAIVEVVAANGMLSRAGLATNLKKMGFDKTQCVKTALAKTLKSGLITHDDACYILGEQTRAAAGDEYAGRLHDAHALRDSVHREKEAQRHRADHKYAKAADAAGGLTRTAKADRAWANGTTSGHRRTPFI